jgi:hypothetical protein
MASSRHASVLAAAAFAAGIAAVGPAAAGGDGGDGGGGEVQPTIIMPPATPWNPRPIPFVLPPPYRPPPPPPPGVPPGEYGRDLAGNWMAGLNGVGTDSLTGPRR